MGMFDSEALYWMMAIFVVFVIVIVFLFPGAILDRVKEAAFSFGFGKLPEERAPEFKGERLIPKDIEDYFNKLASEIKNTKIKPCLKDIGKIPKAKEFSISLYYNKIQIEKVIKEGYTPAERTENVNGFKPCVIKDNDALRFNECGIGDNANYCNDIFTAQEQIKLAENKYSNFLFKSEKNTCFIQVYSDLLWFCDKPRNNGKDGIDDDCITTYTKNIGKCD